MSTSPVAITVFSNDKCEPAWENRAYVHINFGHFFRLRIIITLWLNIDTRAAYNGLFNATYRSCISYTEGEISRIMWRGIICVHKPYFLMPGHKYYGSKLTMYGIRNKIQGMSK